MKQFLAIYIGTAAAREKSGGDSLDEATREERQRVGIGEWITVKNGARSTRTAPSREE